MAEQDIAGMSFDDLVATAYAVSEEPDDEAPAEVATPEAEQDAEPPAKALKQERDRRKQLAAEAEQARAEAAELRAYREQIEAQQRQYQQQQQAAQTREQLVERLAFVDGEEAAQIVEAIRQHDAREFQQYSQAENLTRSADFMRETFPDFDAHLTRAYQEYGPGLDALALQKNPRNPAKWAYEQGKKLDLAENFDARVAAEVQKALPAAIKDVLQKQKPPDTQGHKGIAHVSAGAPGGGEAIPLHKRSLEDIRREAYNL
jgi:hypothetical protein